MSKLYADDVCKMQYDAYLSEVINNAFDPATTQALYDTYADLVEPYATTELPGYSFLNGANDFSNVVSQLKAHASKPRSGGSSLFERSVVLGRQHQRGVR